MTGPTTLTLTIAQRPPGAAPDSTGGPRPSDQRLQGGAGTTLENEEKMEAILLKTQITYFLSKICSQSCVFKVSTGWISDPGGGRRFPSLTCLHLLEHDDRDLHTASSFEVQVLHIKEKNMEASEARSEVCSPNTNTWRLFQHPQF